MASAGIGTWHMYMHVHVWACYKYVCMKQDAHMSRALRSNPDPVRSPDPRLAPTATPSAPPGASPIPTSPRPQAISSNAHTRQGGAPPCTHSGARLPTVCVSRPCSQGFLLLLLSYFLPLA